MTFWSLFDGVYGFGLGFEPAGMECTLRCEVDQQCRSVMEHNRPGIPTVDDVERLRALLEPRHAAKHSREFVRPDGICGGFPCQDLSVAGKRAGLAGGRSGLWFVFRRIVALVRPRWVCIENVPGLLSSDGGRDMGTIVGALGRMGYGWAYRVLDAQWFGVAQRRRRVFIVGCLGDWRGPSEVLFERDSLPWDSAPSREAGAGVAGGAASCLNSGGNSGGFRTEPGEHLIHCQQVAPTINTHLGDKQGLEDQHVRGGCGHFVAFAQNQRGEIRTSEIMPQLTCGGGKPGEGYPAIAFHSRQDPITSDKCLPLEAKGGRAVGVPFVFTERTREDGPNIETSELAYALLNPGDGGRPKDRMLCDQATAVRRLTPRECERLMGWPDDWTLYGHDGREISDSARYRMCGNGVVAPVAEWIGRRIMETAR